MVTNEFSGMPVADPDRRVVDVITEADIIRALLDGKRLENLTAGEVMTGPALAVDAKTTLEEVMKCMCSLLIGHTRALLVYKCQVMKCSMV